MCHFFDINIVVTSLGHNLDSDGTCGLNGPEDLSNVVDPILGPLADNGGPTLTIALLPGSPAIDAGDDSVLGAPHNLATYQRGPSFPRLQGTHVDIGAYEAAPAVVYQCRGLDATIVGTDGPAIILGSTGDDVIVALGGDDTVLVVQRFCIDG